MYILNFDFDACMQIRCVAGCERDGSEAPVHVRQAVRQAQDADARLHRVRVGLQGGPHPGETHQAGRVPARGHVPGRGHGAAPGQGGEEVAGHGERRRRRRRRRRAHRRQDDGAEGDEGAGTAAGAALRVVQHLRLHQGHGGGGPGPAAPRRRRRRRRRHPRGGDAAQHHHQRAGRPGARVDAGDAHHRQHHHRVRQAEPVVLPRRPGARHGRHPGGHGGQRHDGRRGGALRRARRAAGGVPCHLVAAQPGHLRRALSVWTPPFLREPARRQGWQGHPYQGDVLLQHHC